MEGYDTNLIGNLYAYPAFKKQFGQPYKDGYQILGKWQSALGGGATAGAFVGALCNGWLLKRFGFRYVFMGGTILMTAFIPISVFGENVGLQVLGQALCGIPWGIFATIGPAYASEEMPLALRGYLTSYTNMCFAIESPWWLVRAGKHEEAERMMKRLTVDEQRDNARQAIAMMIHTNEIEKEVEVGTSYLDCCKGTNLRRTEIACMAFAGQVLARSQFAYSATYFFEQAGLSSSNTYKLNLGGTAIAFVGTILSWFLMKCFGRRWLYCTGIGLMSIYLFIIGCLDYAHSAAAVQAQSALCLLWLFTFSLSIGPIGWAIPPEVSSTRLRSKTIVLGRNTYYIASTLANVVQPYLINPTELNLRGKTGFFWFAFCTAAFIWACFRLTETKGRTFEELDIMYIARVPTRKFKRYQVDAYAEGVAVADRLFDISKKQGVDTALE
ncbi:Uu.00g073220.m01.CDS01 [Anthostomella pinea]|uniref:Uu.00g073220.m01.CDS01 n=1 Tax=Anthostomella pinea TaxID=933095 RepID=A0AAI8VV74_9PEZI|nr:Uu.00g073220.m01.CDS01 [Anthostomella pinea]